MQSKASKIVGYFHVKPQFLYSHQDDRDHRLEHHKESIDSMMSYHRQHPIHKFLAELDNSNRDDEVAKKKLFKDGPIVR